MIVLGQDWRSALGAQIAADLIARVQGKKPRDVAASYLIGASLDLMAATWLSKDRPPLQVETLSSILWRVSSLYYMYIPANDDAALGKCAKLARSSQVMPIVPPRHERLKRRLLKAILGPRASNTWSFDAFISWRTATAAIDQGWPSSRAILEWLVAYNRRVDAAGHTDLLIASVT